MIQTRDSVSKQIEEFNLLLQTQSKPIEIVLYPKHLTEDTLRDIGLDRVIVMTTVKFKSQEPKRPSQDFSTELIEQIKLAAQSAQGLEVKVKSTVQEDETEKEFIKELNDIDGIKIADTTKYEVHIEKAALFSWLDILPSVVELIESFKLKKMFNVKGLGVE